MARIQVDFDQVMLFGGLHGNLGRGLDGQRAAFRIDANRIDQIIAQFGLSHSTGGATFHGMSIAAAMGDADARAGRVAHTLITTSTRIFQYASSSLAVDTHFSWAGQLGRSVWGPITGPFGTFLAAMGGGEVASFAAQAGKLGRRYTPALGKLLPVFSGVTGVLDIIDASFGLADPDVDLLSKFGYGLTAVSGVIGGAVGFAGIAIAVTAGAGSLAAFAVIAAPALLVATVVGFGGLLIVNRQQVGEVLTGAGRAIGNVAGAIAKTPTEITHDVLDSAGDIWRTVVNITHTLGNDVRDVAFSGAEVVHDALTGVMSGLTRPLLLRPITGGPAVGAAIPLVGATLGPGGALQGSSSGLQGSSPKLQGPGASTPSPKPPVPTTPTPAPSAAVLEPPHGGLQGYLDAAGLHPSPEKWAQGAPADGRADRWNKAAMNCTSWVAYRRSMLNRSIPQGNGGSMGHDAAGAPTLGAVVSYGAGVEGDYGHVMIIEQVISPTQIRVSEMNHDNKGGFYDQRVWTKGPDGMWTCDKPYSEKRVLKFTQ